MIVKDEADIIVQTLQNVTSHIPIDYWVICDTGSSDKTAERIQEFFHTAKIPGELFHTPWKDFGHNRTVALNHAYKKTDYVLVWDADDEVRGDFLMPSEWTSDVYSFVFGDEHGLRYNRRLMFNNQKKWKYEGVLHEYAVCVEKTTEPFFVKGNYYFVSGRSGNRNKDPNKLLNDAKILKRAYFESLKKKEWIRGRYAFYCANSYFNAGQFEDAILFYKKTLETDTWDQEKYVACLRIYEAYEHLKQPTLGLEYLEKSYEYNKTRIECVYRLVKHYCCLKLSEKAYTYYIRVQNYYEQKYLQDDVSTHLFSYKIDYEFNFPYFMIIVAERLKKYDIGVKMYEILFQKRQLAPSEFYMNCLFYNLQYFVEHLPTDNMSFVQNMVGYVNGLYQDKRIRLSPASYKTIANIVGRCTPMLTKYTLRTFDARTPVHILFTMTTCKRFDLFAQTMNSVLNCWKDLDKVDRFLCIDDNSSPEDRAKMQSLYPFFEFCWKTEEEKGHKHSMNILWDTLQRLRPKYWIHLEDDWMFFRQDTYVAKSIQCLETYESQQIHQVLFNRHYAETLEEWCMNGGEPLDKESIFLAHTKVAGIEGLNCGYWPHYSLRPSMTRVDTILALGNYESQRTFFEYEYAKRYDAKGYRSAFFNEITSLHTGKLASEQTGINAYALNDIKQLDRSNTIYYLFYNDEDISEFLHPYIIPIQLQPGTILFDSQGFLNINSIPDVQNIGFLTPALLTKTHIKKVSDLFQFKIEPNTVYGFVFNYENCIYDSLKCHGPNFKPIWDYMIEAMGYKDYIGRDFMNCYCNMWVSEAHYAKEFLTWVKQASQILYSAPESIQTLLNSDALYKSIPPKTLLEKFGFPYYTFHPFVLERLIGLFVIVHKLNLLNTNPAKSRNGRYVFMCAENALQAKRYDDATMFYIQTLETDASNDEKYVSCIHIFELYDLKKQPERGLEFLERSYEYSKTRLECTYRLIRHYCTQKLNDTAHTYFLRNKAYYEDNPERIVPPTQYQAEYDFFLPYYMIIVSERLKNYTFGLKMYEHIFRKKVTTPGEWNLNCLFHNLRFFVKHLPEKHAEFVDNMVGYINVLYQEKKYRLSEECVKTVSMLIDQSLPSFTEPCLFKPALSDQPNCILTLTSCGRFGKLDKTINSILHCWDDLYKVHGFVCVVEHISEFEREKIQTTFPQFTFVWKTKEDGGVAKSMNLLWDILQEKRPKYWIHLDDNWIFFHRDTYVTKAMECLETFEDKQIHQVVFNRHYAESIEEWCINGGEHLSPMFVAHSKMTGIKGAHYGYWPHYKLMPSMTRTQAILDVGPFPTNVSYFEYEYAKRYAARGYRTAFFNSISSCQIEKDTQSELKKHALSNIAQLENSKLVYYLFYSDEDISAFEHPNIIPIQLQPGTIFFESQGYLNIGIIPDAQYIGFITPSLFYKTHIQNVEELFQIRTEPSTIYGFVFNYENCLSDTIKNHGDTFKTLWEYMIEELGYSEHLQTDFMNCYCNMWIAESAIVKRFLECIKRAAGILTDASGEIRTLLNSDSLYEGKIPSSVLLEKFGFPHYTYHTFVLERLIGFFATLHSYPIVHLHPAKRRNSFLSDPNRLVHYNTKNTFVINLLRRKDRKQTMIQLFRQPMTVRFFEAIDGQTLEYTQDIHSMFRGNDFGNRKGFVGCALSHYTLWKRLLEGDQPYLLIFEDDVSTIEQYGLPLAQHRKFVEANLSQVDMYFLGFSVKPQNESFKYSKPDNRDEFCTTLDKDLYIGGFFSYMITRVGAQKLLEYIHIHGIKHGIDYLVKLVPGLRCLSAQPHLFFSECAFTKDSAVDSDIQKTMSSFPILQAKRKTRVKMLCNWCDSESLCKEWDKLSKGKYTWNDIQITWENNDIDYYVILNKPQKGAYFVPERTIVFQMEPWCSNRDQTWGVKTWGEWADVYQAAQTKFLHVHSHRNYCNVAFWQINKTHTQLQDLVRNKPDYTSKVLSTVCSSKYFDPGHIKRIDFLHFLETKKDITLHIYNEDNRRGFRSYMGKARPNIDKGKGILPYKYYFMCENNSEKNFITEKLWEPILCETLCFYWGCPNVSDHIDPLAYVPLDMDDFEGSYRTIVEAIQSDLWSKRLPILQAEKKKILNNYSFFPLLESILQTNEIARVYTKHFLTLPTIRNICFVHSCTIRNTERLDALLLSLHSSDAIKLLDKVVILNIGTALDPTQYTHPKLLIINFSENIHLYELPTLQLLHRFSQDYVDTNILYLHTKGVSYSPDDVRYKNILDWIQYMTYGLVQNYKHCVEALKTYDVVGCNRLESPFPHFSGNFWWANSNYIRTLNTHRLTDKLSAEWWVLSNPGRCFTVHSSKVNHFEQPYPIERYKHILEKKILVVYTYFPSPSANHNLRTFLYSVQESDSIDYILVVNGRVCEVELPNRSNLRVLKRDNIGFDFGGHKAALDSVNLDAYAYFFCMNSSVTGPILPTYFPPTLHWTSIFTNKLTEKVKLVGTTIVCLPESDAGGFGPKVEGFFFLTDRIGLALLLGEGTIFVDHPDKRSAIVNGEYGLSRCIFRHGYTIDCMLQRYQGMDWRNPENMHQNGYKHPSRHNSYFQTSINPYEVVFHKWFWQGEKDVNFSIVDDYFKHVRTKA